MRDRNKNLARRRRRRTALATALLLWLPTATIADEPGKRWKPPLPLEVAANVRANPFCLPDADDASNTALSELGNPVELAPVGRTSRATGTRPTPRPTVALGGSATGDPPEFPHNRPDTVQPNPLADSGGRRRAGKVNANRPNVRLAGDARGAPSWQQRTARTSYTFSFSDRPDLPPPIEPDLQRPRSNGVTDPDRSAATDRRTDWTILSDRGEMLPPNRSSKTSQNRSAQPSHDRTAGPKEVQSPDATASSPVSVSLQDRKSPSPPSSSQQTISAQAAESAPPAPQPANADPARSSVTEDGVAGHDASDRPAAAEPDARRRVTRPVAIIEVAAPILDVRPSNVDDEAARGKQRAEEKENGSPRQEHVKSAPSDDGRVSHADRPRHESAAEKNEEETVLSPEPKPRLVRTAPPSLVVVEPLHESQPPEAAVKEFEATEPRAVQGGENSDAPGPASMEQTASLASGHQGVSPPDRADRRRPRRSVATAQADEAGATPAPIPAPGSPNNSVQSSVTSDRVASSEPLPHRPPVAVVATPVAFRSDSQDQPASIVRPAAQTHDLGDRPPRTASLTAAPETVAPKATPQPSIEGVPEDIDVTPLSIEPAQVRSLTILGDLKRFAVADNEVCQIFRSGESQLKVIGVEAGVTQLAVWAVTESGEPPKLRVFEIRVAEALGRGGPLADDPTERLNDSLRRVFPAADVRVHRRGDTLVVSGRCGGNAAATEIIRLVRKSCLIPVKDELVIR